MNPGKDLYNCYKCGAGGSLHDIFANIRRTETQAAVQTGVKFTFGVEPPGEVIPLTQLDPDHLAMRYLRGRGFRPEILERYYGLRYCTRGRLYAGGLFDTTNTLIFPVWMNGTVAGWQSRLLYNPDKLTDEDCAALGWGKDEDGKYIRAPKYFTSPGVDRSRLLFNYDMARTSEIVVVCEGPTDALSVGPCAVACLGKGISPPQAGMLKAYWKLVIILLDPGDADREMQELMHQLWLSVPAIPVDLKGYKDAGEAPTMEIWSQIYATASSHGIDLANYNLGPYWLPEVFK